MRIGELARRTGIAASRIRFYEKRLVLPQASRGGNGYRDYDAAAAKTLTLIDQAQRLGFTLGEIRAALSEAAPEFPSRAAMAKALRHKLGSLDEHIREAQARRRRLRKILQELEGSAEGAGARGDAFPEI